MSPRWIKRTGIHVPGLNANHSMIVEPRQRSRSHASLAVHRNPSQARTPEPKQRKRLQHRDVNLFAYRDANRRRTKQPIFLDVPSGVLQQCGPTCRQEKFAIVVPVTNPTPDPDGRPSMSIIHAMTISSILTVTGDITYIAAFWSQALAISQQPLSPQTRSRTSP